ncbi:SlyX family protein [Saccharophagus sp. K07]|jgi:SlyX protein|uniref:SlyX family protein n=1 Tax=Saccharophagus sp. K07 TaxID=2283636 RepID=UPI0021052785|nr:SlyX family protein [Saccharophagus sp. K07]
MTNSSELSPVELTEHIQDLQARLAFQEDALQVMSEQMALQAQELQMVREQMQVLNKKLNDLFYQMEQRAEAPPIERPPHY